MRFLKAVAGDLLTSDLPVQTGQRVGVLGGHFSLDFVLKGINSQRPARQPCGAVP